MTNEQKIQIKRMRTEGVTYQRIGQVLGLPMNTVKTYCRRNSISVAVKTQPGSSNTDDTFCQCCGKELVQTPGKKRRKFCSPACRTKWWNSHLEMVDRKAVYTLVCKHCGKSFTTYGIAKQKYCSHACYIAERFGKECDLQ